MSGFFRAIIIIISVWVVSMISALPHALLTRINYVDRPLGSGHYLPQSAFCALLDSNMDFGYFQIPVSITYRRFANRRRASI